MVGVSGSLSGSSLFCSVLSLISVLCCMVGIPLLFSFLSLSVVSLLVVFMVCLVWLLCLLAAFFLLFFCSSVVVGCLLIVGRFDE